MRERLIKELNESLAKEHEQTRKIRRVGLGLEEDKLEE